jgi:hypothetical protein
LPSGQWSGKACHHRQLHTISVGRNHIALSMPADCSQIVSGISLRAREPQSVT